MDDLERRLAALLSEPSADDPPPGLADRIHRAVATRRRNRRALVLAAAAGATAVLVAVPLAVRGGNGDATATAKLSPAPASTPASISGRAASSEPTVTMTPTPDQVNLTAPAGVLLERALRELMNVTSVVDVGGRTERGERFVPAALGSDGTVLGSTPDGQVAEVGASGGTPRELGIAARSGLGTATGFRTWTEGSAADQRCRTADGTTRTISPQGTDPRAQVWVDGGVIVGSDVMRQPWVAKGCAGVGTVVRDGNPASGEAVAFSYPYLFTAEAANDKVLRIVDVETGRVAAEHPLPEGVRAQSMAEPDQEWYAAASGKWFAWVAGDTLRWVPRDSWGPVSELPGVPTPEKGVSPWMTAGNRLVTYNTGAYSFLLDPVTGRRYKSPDVMLAAGEWLLWRNGDGYRLANLR
ncbi:hypothetical protein MTP10_06050 [Nonomuraea sp. 3-1Str]|uniref:hypothetical protein n=1 Tax=Nonomuraea sp. 3-1Str TaxID=2929801 RepID=UPI002855787C|nr:hypothetical protein [Nonomuraea sp. 3-1Str]MDR8408293.1 hypothetical protein [Nonomuraea sp. 3-1Str]